MKFHYSFYLLLFAYFSCQNEFENVKLNSSIETLAELRKIEKKINEAYLEECTSDLEKKLCKDVWYIDMNDFQKDTLIATKVNKNSFPLQFACNRTIPFQDVFSGHYSGKWNEIDRNLNIEFKGSCSEKSTSGGLLTNYIFDIKIDYKIIKLDSVLHLVSINKERTNLKVAQNLVCY
ncbi:MAG: hypothetical protein ACJAT4_000580 [Granulosicoccus sp.]|jgi:hypothetical protein